LGNSANADFKLLFLLLTYSATEERGCSSRDFESHEFFFPDARFSGDPHVRHVLASGRIHEMRNRVVAGGELRFVEGDRAQVGRLARREGPDRGFQAERAGAVKGGRGESLMRRHRRASFPTVLARSAAVRISWNRSRRLLLAAPSVPMPTLIPRASIAATGARPLASLRLDEGQCATEAPWCASVSISAPVRCTACAATRRGESMPSARSAPAAAACTGEAVLDLCSRLVQVGMDGKVELLGDGDDPRKVLSLTVYGACGAMQKDRSGSSRRASRAASPLAM